MTNARINGAIYDRLATRLAHDAATAAAERRFYAATAKLEQLDPALFAELDAAFVDWSDAALSGAWLHGFACGRDPLQLVLDGGEGDE